MLQFLTEYGIFLAKTITIVIAIIIIITAVASAAGKGKGKGKEKLKIKKLNDKYRDMQDALNAEILTKKDYKKAIKAERKAKKNKKAEKTKKFVIDFKGDIKASPVNCLRETITALLNVATSKDEIIARIESSGGMIHAYGLAASQLQRIRDAKIPLTVIVDKVAASGGYLMAAVANRILAAPFAIIGSIGVVAQLPNFHKLLKKHNIDYEQITAGEYKRTLSIFGEITDKGRAKAQEEIDEAHELFKNFILQNRPKLDLKKLATGEYWHGTQALKLGLIDEVTTSDDYLLNLSKTHDIYEISYITKKKLTDRLHESVGIIIKKINELFC